MNQSEAIAKLQELSETAMHVPVQQAGAKVAELAAAVLAALTQPAQAADTTGTAG